MSEMSLRGYARHRGVQLQAVQKAVKTGRIEILRQETRGSKTYFFVDSDKCDTTWQERTDPVQQRTATRRDMGIVENGAPQNIPEQTKQTTPGGVSKNSTGAGGEMYGKARAAKEAFAAKMAELNYLERVGKKLDTDIIMRIWADMSSMVRDNMLNIPARISAILAAETDEKKVNEILMHEIRVVLTNLADDKLNNKIAQATSK